MKTGSNNTLESCQIHIDLWQRVIIDFWSIAGDLMVIIKEKCPTWNPVAHQIERQAAERQEGSPPSLLPSLHSSVDLYTSFYHSGDERRIVSFTLINRSLLDINLTAWIVWISLTANTYSIMLASEIVHCIWAIQLLIVIPICIYVKYSMLYVKCNM